jgi:predicted nucleic acid-binding protein
MEKYYIDTSVWIDFYEDRKGYHNEPLGDFAFKLLSLIISKKDKVIITDYLLKELNVIYSEEEIDSMFKLFENLIEVITVSKLQTEEANKISNEKNVPAGDVLHAIVARDNNLILITRDKHFTELDNISKHYKPEEII